ncbi:MAG TPA: nucleoside triphosphate pyrophosphohydrolase [Methylocystis sp.]|nr:nucleoside triphosphate pyrophosphohydrolase [Methylocystis sp.]
MTISRLIGIMAALRTPGTGCPWDLAQTSRTIAPYAIEEAYEVVDAIERGDAEDIKDELGDLLLQVVFHARLAQEAGDFAFEDVVGAICDKMVRRHPHVFGLAAADDPEAVTLRWSEVKAAEKAARHAARGEPQPSSLLDGVPKPLPALTRAVKLQEKAGKVGFDWPSAREVLDKIREETAEVEAELAQEPGAPTSQALFEEVGDLLFVVANLARKTGVDPEQALRAANAKFERRFHHIEARLAEGGRSPAQATLEEMEALWVEAKRSERALGDVSN